jgi:hypothetical protein
MAKKKLKPIIIWWKWKSRKEFDDWLFDVKEGVNTNLNTTETYKKKRLAELDIYEKWAEKL